MATMQVATNAGLSQRLLRQVLFAVVLLAALLVAIVGGSAEAPRGFAPGQVSAVSHGPAPAGTQGPAATFH